MAKSAPRSPQKPKPILEQYKAYMSDLGNIGSRYATAQAFYASIVSGLLALLAIKDRTTDITTYLNWVTVAICCFIVAICWLWYRTLMFYRGIFGVKFDILKRMERADGLFAIYKLEDDEIEKKSPYPRWLDCTRASVSDRSRLRGLRIGGRGRRLCAEAVAIQIASHTANSMVIVAQCRRAPMNFSFAAGTRQSVLPRSRHACRPSAPGSTQD